MNERGAPTPVAWTRLRAPESLMGLADPAAMKAAVESSAALGDVQPGRRPRVGPREARGPLEEGARKAEEDARVKEEARQAKVERSRKPAPAPRPQDDDGLVMDVVKSPVFKDFMRTAAREIARGMFKSGRR